MSKKCIGILKGLLEKNPNLRIELNDPLIKDWLNESINLKYKTRKNKKEIDEKDKEKEIDNSDLEMEIVSSNTRDVDNFEKSIEKEIEEIKIDEEIQEINEDDIIREPAKFEIKEDEGVKNKKFGSTILNKPPQVIGISNSSSGANFNKKRVTQRYTSVVEGIPSNLNKFKNEKFTNENKKNSPKKTSNQNNKK